MSSVLGKHPSLYMVSLGCPKNRVDSEVMLGSLKIDGFRLTQDPSEAEVIVINSCAFIGEAKEESIEAVFEHARFKDEGKCRSLVVAGCLAQRYPEALMAEMPEVDHFVGTGAYDQIARILRGEAARATVPDPDSIGYTADTPRVNSMPGYTAYLKISEGCDNKCAFCIIPTLRGGQRSRPIKDLVAEASRLASAGVQEISLVAQDLTAYGYDQPGKPRLHELLRELAQVPVKWIRIHYAYPRDFPDALIEVIAGEPRIAKYIDMPIQHATDRMLRLMKRGRDRAFLERLMAKLHDRIPGLVMRTSFIVGFPGETEEDFDSLCAFVEEQRFERMGVFEFSREEGTASFDMEGQVPARVKHARRGKLMRLQRSISRAHQKTYLGKVIDVLVEGVSPESEHLLVGRHMGQAPEIDGQVYINSGTARPGAMVKVRVEQAGEYDLVGGIEGAVEPAALSGPARRKGPLLPVLGQAPVRL